MGKEEEMIKKIPFLRHPEVLKEFYIPKEEEILYRDKEIKELAGYLSYTLSECPPPHILVLGVRGTGKTAMVRFLMNKLKDKIETKDLGWIGYTLKPKNALIAMTSLCNSMGFKFPSMGVSFDEIIMRWERKTKGKISIMIIDEIDTLPNRHLNELLYNLSRRGKTSVIGVTQRMTIMNRITDPNVQSTFVPRIVITSPYTAKQLENILRKRVKKAFNPNTISDEVIRLCAALATRAGGDCRYGIQLLSFGADRAIREGDKILREKHIRAAQKDVEEAYVLEGIGNLKSPHKILFWGILEGHKEIKKLFAWYNKIVDVPLTERRLSDYIFELEFLGYISREGKSLGRGKGVKWFLHSKLNTKIVRDVFVKILEQDPYTQSLLKIT